VLVDFDDQHLHPLLRRWSRQRQAAYRAREWFEIGMDPVEERVKAFVASRPGGANV
jgi:hypothetical protein